MRKLNEKGLSIVELLVCFVIVAVVAITLLNTLMDYKSEEEIENVKNHVESYKNTVSRVIQSDITNYAIIGYSNKIHDKKNGTLEVTLKFEKQFEDGTDEKKLIIVASDKENYIIYPDVVKQEDGTYKQQNIKYELESTGTVLDVDHQDDTSTKKEYNDLRFSYLNEDLISVKDGHTISIDIPINHSELGDRYHIKIVAPLALLSSVKEKENTECTLYYSSSGTPNTTCTPGSITVGIGSSWGQSLCTLTKTGYQFSGWNINDGCTGKNISATDICTNKTSIVYAYPCWEGKKYTLTLDPNGGTYTGSTSRTMTYGKKSNNSIGKVSKDGYTFKGWKTSTGALVYDSNGKNLKNTTYWTDAYSDGTWKYDGNLTLYANLIPNSTRITLNGNGATTNANPTYVTATYNSSSISPTSLTSLPERKYTVTIKNTGSKATRNTSNLTFTDTTLTSTYAFNGWRIAQSSSSPKILKNTKTLAFENSATGYTSSDGKWISTNSAVTVYADWSARSIGLPSVSQTGYTCGFTTSSTGTSIMYSSGGGYTPSGNVTLYPVCVPNNYTLTYNYSSGSGSCTSITKPYGSTWGTLCSGATRNGYDFVDWVKSGSTSTKLTSSTTVSGNVTALANWSYCEDEVGSWRNDYGKIKIYSLYSTKSYYKKENQGSTNSYTEVKTEKTWISDQIKHYNFRYYSSGSQYNYGCYSKYDSLKPTRPYIDNVHANSSSTSVESTCTKNTVACAITVTTTGANHYDIGWTYHYGDQGSTYENGCSGVRYVKKEYHYSNGSTCTETKDIKTDKWDKTCDDDATFFDYYTIDDAGNRSEAETVAIWWTKK